MNRPSDNVCQQLDAYLDGELSPGEVSRFAAHQRTCAACREAADEQRWIDALLQSDEAAELEAAPPLWAAPLRRWAPRRVLVAAAAVFAVIAAWRLIPFPARNGLGDGRATVAQVPPSDRAAVAPEGQSPSSPAIVGNSVSRATFVSAGSSIAIPVASADPQITIVKLYPTVTASRRWVREAALRASALPPNGG